jgi:hypothetical protein
VINVSAVEEVTSGFYRTIHIETEDGLQLEITVHSADPDLVRVFF